MKRINVDRKFHEKELEIRATPETLLELREQLVVKEKEFTNIYEKLESIHDDLETLLKNVNGYYMYSLSLRSSVNGGITAIQHIDRSLWRQLSEIYRLKNFMLCTEYEKLLQEIDDYKTPEFTKENVYSWLSSLKDLINGNIKITIKKVYKDIISSRYFVGSASYKKNERKRNNNGVDKFFIISAKDFFIDSWGFKNYSRYPTITDDLEKACYLLDGKILPEISIKDEMKTKNLLEYQNEYFKLKLCKNGNTHYEFINMDILKKLNLYGPEGNEIGEDIKIKVFG